MPSTSASPAAMTAVQAHSDADSIANDRLVGAEQIGHFIDPNLSPRETRRLLETGLYPAWREGRQYVASKAAIREHWQRMTRGFRPPEPKGDRRAQHAASTLGAA